MPRISIHFAYAVFAACLCVPATNAFSQTSGMIEFFDAGKVRKGMVLMNVANDVVVIGRDGWMHSLNKQNPKARIRSLEGEYTPVPVTELRNELRAEFGRNFEVMTTNHFLVVQPSGRGDRWPKMFEESHRSFTDYMRKRGVKVRKGRFPMVAVVLPDQQAMYREFEKLEIDVSRVSGVYAGESNRVMTHDGGRISQIAATVRHEAAHQSAFNSGIDSRVNDTPRWISEGVGQMFEPAGMTATRSGSRLSDRVNRESLAYLQRTFKNQHDERFSSAVLDLIGGEMMFKETQKVEEAYSVSWAMTVSYTHLTLPTKA